MTEWRDKRDRSITKVFVRAIGKTAWDVRLTECGTCRKIGRYWSHEEACAARDKAIEERDGRKRVRMALRKLKKDVKAL